MSRLSTHIPARRRSVVARRRDLRRLAVRLLLGAVAPMLFLATSAFAAGAVRNSGSLRFDGGAPWAAGAGPVPGRHAPTVPQFRALARHDAGALDSEAFSRLLGFGSSIVGSTPVGAGPAVQAIDPATHTLYVTNGLNLSGPNVGGNTVSVIDTRRCQARDVRRLPGSMAHDHRRQRAERHRDRRGDRHRLCEQYRRQHGVGVSGRDLQRRERVRVRPHARDRACRHGADQPVRRPGRSHRLHPRRR